MSLQSRSGVVIKRKKKQGDGIISTLLGSIAAPMILNKLLGGGLHNRKNGHSFNRIPLLGNIF